MNNSIRGQLNNAYDSDFPQPHVVCGCPACANATSTPIKVSLLIQGGKIKSARSTSEVTFSAVYLDEAVKSVDRKTDEQEKKDVQSDIGAFVLDHCRLEWEITLTAGKLMSDK